jgi:hypothetical protein
MATDFGVKMTNDNIARLDKSIRGSWRMHYMLRRLPILGVMLLLVPIIVLLFSYLAIPKEQSFGLDILTWLITHEGSHSAMVWKVFILVVSAMTTILALTFGGWKKKTSAHDGDSWDWKLGLNLIALAVAVLPSLLLMNNIGHMTIFIFI